MSTKPFHFKQFSIAQDRCAMKIGTDGVLLGAWTAITDFSNSILDVGTGTGVIAMMLAQRSDAQVIDAVELDDNAYEQATENFENSNWGDRLFCYHAHLYEFALEIDEQYDLIVCNPPFYEQSSLPLEGENVPSKERQMARFEGAMPFELLVGAVVKLLSPEGRFNVIIPHDREEDFILLCSRANLYPTRLTRVKGMADLGIKRSMMEFRFDNISQEKNTTSEMYVEGDDIRFRESVTQPIIDELVVEKSRHDYTQDYINLVKDFYLKL